MTMSKTDSLHYDLCRMAATWIRQPKNKEKWHSPYNLSTVELVCYGVCLPDVYATNGEISAIIEVKTSHSDYERDGAKYSLLKPDRAIGDFRYYLCPENIIKIDELPPYWGLLYYKDGKIKKIRSAIRQPCDRTLDMFVLMSIMRREGLLGKTYNYRKQE